MKKGHPKGFKCKCGTFHAFEAYVWGHWNEELIHTCPVCDRKHSVFAGEVELISEGRKKRKAIEK